MARIRRKDTGPEVLVRRLLHAEGYRSRLHRRDLPGTPDIVLPARRKVIFVNGCFWHGHARCRLACQPSTRTEFWVAKFVATRRRDLLHLSSLRHLGWSVLTIWECELAQSTALADRMRDFLDADGGLPARALGGSDGWR